MKTSQPCARRNRLAGFTLLEMLVVLVIVGLLVSLVGPRLFSRVDTAKTQTAAAQIKLLRGAIETMRLDTGIYPPADPGLQMLVIAPNAPEVRQRWRGPYLEGAVPLDPWGNPYQYQPPESSNKAFSITSFGADGKPGGEGNDQDIGLENLPSSGR